MSDPYNQQPVNPYDQFNEQYRDYDRTPRFPHHAATVTVESLVFVPTGTYQDQWRRPWVTEFNQSNVNQVYEVVAHAYHDYKAKHSAGSVAPDSNYMIDPLDLSAVSASFIQPAAAGEAQARLRLLHSLQYQTARFIMVIRVDRHGAVEPNRYVINGYSNHMGLVQKQGRAGLNQSDFAVDHQMEMTVNSIMEVRQVWRDYGYGQQISSEMVSVNQVLVDPQYDSVDNAQVIRLRPYEVASTLARMTDPQVTRNGVHTTDTRAIQNATPALSDVHHSNPNDYMARIISGLANGRDQAINRGQSGLIDPYNNATRELRDAASHSDPFLKAISSFTDGVVSASFKFRDLLKVDPNAERDDICFVNMRDYTAMVGVRGQNMAYGGDTSEWHGQDLPTQWAAQLANMISPMMMDLGMRKVDIIADNSHGEIFVKCTNAIPFVKGVNLAPQLQALDRLFYQQFVLPMSENNQIRHYIDVNVDLYGEITINISIGGGPRYVYVYPAFISAATSPVLSTKSDTLDHIANSFRNLQREILPVQRPLITELGTATPPSGNRY
jgi:hypothetical protein